MGTFFKVKTYYFTRPEKFFLKNNMKYKKFQNKFLTISTLRNYSGLFHSLFWIKLMLSVGVKVQLTKALVPPMSRYTPLCLAPLSPSWVLPSVRSKSTCSRSLFYLNYFDSYPQSKGQGRILLYFVTSLGVSSLLTFPVNQRAVLYIKGTFLGLKLSKMS